MLLPIHGDKLAEWFPYWLQSCRGNPRQEKHFEMEWFIFHEDLRQLEDLQEAFVPPNVHFVNLHKNGLANLFGVKTAKALNRDPNEQVEVYRRCFGAYGGYLLTELKGLFGLIFEDYTSDFTHWGWADHDVIWGDLQWWVEASELDDYDIASYSFGDNQGVYLRGQLTFFRNNQRNNLLWTKCALLTGHPRPRGSDEACFTYYVLHTPGLKIKIATKQSTPFDSDSVFYWIDGQLLERRPANEEDSHEFEERLIEFFYSGAASFDDAVSLFFPPPHPPTSPHTSLSEWTRTPFLRDTSQCLSWMDPRFRMCVSIERDYLHNLLVDDCKVYRQSFEFTQPAGRMFVHLFAWKRTFRKVVPPEPRIVVFRISSTGVTPLVTAPLPGLMVHLP